MMFGRPQAIERAAAGPLLATLSTAALAVFFVSTWSSGSRAALAHDAYVSVYIAAALLCWLRSRGPRTTAIRWEYIGVGIMSVPAAIVVAPHSAALSDVIALGFYAGVALALAPRHATPKRHLPALRWIDAALVTTGVLTLIAYAAYLAALEPSMMWPGLYRPLAPAAAVLAMLPPASRLTSPDRWRADAGASCLLSGVAVAIAADLAAVDGLNRVLWVSAAWLMGIGATLAARDQPSIDPLPQAMPSWWPAAAAGGVYALVALEFGRIEPVGSRILVIGGTAAAFLLLARQIAGLRENQRLLRHTAHLEKREAVGRAAADVAHEFNNLLTAMVGHIEVLDADLPEDHRGHGNLRELRQATAGAITLTRSLLGAARPGSAAVDIVDLNSLAREVASMFQPSLGADREVHVDLSETPCLARGEPLALRHVLVNLLINARDAMPHGGSITMATRIVPAASLPPGAAFGDGDYVRVTIQDTGCGMTSDVLARAFDPFFTTKPVGHGTGLGLAFVFSTVREHGGLVDVSSAPGEGSTFTLWLPSAAAP